MTEFDTTAYGAEIAAILAAPRLMPLGPGTPEEAVRNVGSLDVDRLFAHAELRDRSMAAACVAGLWLHQGFLDRSHKVSQRLSSAEGNYWHGIMHRRDGDYTNAKYWFRRVGAHRIHPALAEAGRELARGARASEAAFLVDQTSWDAAAFTDLCQGAVSRGNRCERLCREVQQREWELLFDHCYRLAVHID